MCEIIADHLCCLPQEETLRGKLKVLANIEELERLTPLLKEALQEEHAGIKAAEVASARAGADEAAAAKVAEAQQASAGEPFL